MRISYNWLSEYISIPFSPDELAERLTMLGIEVESMERPAERMRNVVVGEVLEVVPHPNADILRLTKVSVGNGEPLKIVCGAPNVRPGLHVAVAQIGADLGEGMVIKKAKIRGEESQGMLCSERELGISDKHAGIWELPDNLAIGAPLAEAMGLDDVIFEIGITPNRADCLSYIGIAREVRAVTGEKIHFPKISISKTGGAIEKSLKISLPQPDLCPRYVAKLVRGVTVKPSPEWMKRKLEASGLRPINNVVDVTNFVLMECGHPLHAFDFDTVQGGEIVVRTAGGFAEDYITLDGKTRKLPPDALLITNGKKPLGIAGIMGGENSEIRDSTKNVLIESAYFLPSSIRRTAKQLGLSTDASYRFERGTNFDVLMGAATRAAELMVELGGGEIVEGMIDEYPKELPHLHVRFRPSRVNAVLGMDIPVARMEEICARLDLEIESHATDSITVRVPSYRVDIEREEDIIEEVARVIGYDQIPTSTFERAPLGASRDPLKLRDFDNIIRSTLLSIGANENVSLPLVSAKDAVIFHPKPVELLNPLNAERDRMRSSVAINLLEATRHNESFGAQGQRFFEIGNVFHYSDRPELLGVVHESTELGILLSGVQEEKSPYNATANSSDIYYLKGIVGILIQRIGLREVNYTTGSANYFDTEEQLAISVQGNPVGIMGKLSVKAGKAFDLRQIPYLALLDHRALYSLAREAVLNPRHVQPLPKYPSVERDIALVLEASIPAKQIETVIRSEAPAAVLRDIRLFDEYRSPEMKAAHERSLAFHLVFRSDERTLEEHEVDALINLIIKRLERELHTRLRA